MKKLVIISERVFQKTDAIQHHIIEVLKKEHTKHTLVFFLETGQKIPEIWEALTHQVITSGDIDAPAGTKRIYKLLAKLLERSPKYCLLIEPDAKIRKRAKQVGYRTLHISDKALIEQTLQKWGAPTLGDFYHKRAQSNKGLLHAYALILLGQIALAMIAERSFAEYAIFILMFFGFLVYRDLILHFPTENSSALKRFILPAVANPILLIAISGTGALLPSFELSGTMLVIALLAAGVQLSLKHWNTLRFKEKRAVYAMILGTALFTVHFFIQIAAAPLTSQVYSLLALGSLILLHQRSIQKEAYV